MYTHQLNLLFTRVSPLLGLVYFTMVSVLTYTIWQTTLVPNHTVRLIIYYELHIFHSL